MIFQNINGYNSDSIGHLQNFYHEIADRRWKYILRKLANRIGVPLPSSSQKSQEIWSSDNKLRQGLEIHPYSGGHCKAHVIMALETVFVMANMTRSDAITPHHSTTSVIIVIIATAIPQPPPHPRITTTPTTNLSPTLIPQLSPSSLYYHNTLLSYSISTLFFKLLFP